MQKATTPGRIVMERALGWSGQFGGQWGTLLGGLALAGVAGGLTVVNVTLGLGLAGGLLLAAVLLPRPHWIAYLLILSYPFTGGMARGGILPGLRLSQAILLAAFGLFFFARSSRLGKYRLTLLDLAFGVTLLTGSVFPVLAVFLRGDAISNDDIAYGQTPFQLLVGPIQYYLLYRIVVAAISSAGQVKTILNILFGASLVVALLGILQKAGVGPVKNFLETYYPTPTLDAVVTEEGQRITSTMVHWAGLGAYLCLSLLLALACYLLNNQLKLNSWLLAATALFDTVALVLTGTMVAWIALVLGGLLVFKLSGRWPSPKVLIYTGVGLALAVAGFMPFLQARFDEQIGQGASSSILPQSLDFRVTAWTQIFLPAIGRNLIFGAGPTPPELNYWPTEESQYLYLLLRGGIPNFLSYWFLMLMGFLACWQLLKNRSGFQARPVAIATFAMLIAINIMNLTANYFTAFGPTQLIWELLAVVVACNQLGKLGVTTAEPAAPAHSRPLALPPGSPGGGKNQTSAASVNSGLVAGDERPGTGLIGRLRTKLDWRFVKDSLIVGVGSTLSRVLGLLFQILLARFLTASDYGFVRYSITLAGILTIVSAASPASLARFLAAHPNDPNLRNRYFSTGMVGVAALLGLTLLVSVPLLLLLQALDIGTLVSILGLTAFFTYFAVVRGLSNAWKMSLSYLLTNLWLLVTLFLVLGFMGIHTTTAALTVYGLSNIVPLILMELVRPTRLTFRLSLVSRAVLRELSQFSWTLILANGAYTIWFGVDILLVQQFTPEVAGQYAAAKTLSMAFVFVPTAIFLVLMPKVAALGLEQSKRYVWFGVGVALLLSVLGVAIIALWGGPLLEITFGSRYLAAQTPLLVLGIGMTFYAVYTILEGFMVGQGRPGLHAQAMVVAMVTACLLGWYLIPTMGALGGSLSFTLGAIVGMVVLVFNTRSFIRTGSKVEKYAEV